MPMPTLDQLMEAPHHHIRAILLALCNDIEVQQTALAHLQSLQDFDTDTSSKAPKRKAMHEALVCGQCDEVFSDEDNNEGDCIYHPGL